MRERFICDLADPAATLAEILARSGAGLGDVVIAHVDMASQRVTGTRIVEFPPPADVADRHPVVQREFDRAALSDTLHEVAVDLAAERE